MGQCTPTASLHVSEECRAKNMHGGPEIPLWDTMCRRASTSPPPTCSLSILQNMGLLIRMGVGEESTEAEREMISAPNSFQSTPQRGETEAWLNKEEGWPSGYGISIGSEVPRSLWGAGCQDLTPLA